MKKLYFGIAALLFLAPVVTCGQVIMSHEHFTVHGSENSAMLNNLFDNNIQSTWNADTAPAWLVLKANEGAAFPINGLTITNHQSASSTISITLSGSTDSATFVPLHTANDLVLSGSKRTEVTFANDVRYPYILIELSTADPAISLAEMRFLAQGPVETFSNLNISASATDVNGSYTGDNGISWSYTRSRDGQTYGAEGKSLMMRGQNSAKLRATVPEGAKYVSFEYSLAFNTIANGVAFFNVTLKSVETGEFIFLGSSEPVGNTPVEGFKTFTSGLIDIQGEAEITIAAKEKPVVIDNLGWFGSPAEKQFSKFNHARVNEPHPSAYRKVLTLDGNWAHLDEVEVNGETEEWFIPGNASFPENVVVPAAIQASGLKQEFYEDIRWKNIAQQTANLRNSWLRKDFVLNAVNPDERTWLEFGGVHPACKVWLNGIFLGKHNLCNVPFKFDITDAVNGAGINNTLIVKIEEDLASRALGGHFNKNTYWSGIYRDVEIETTGLVSLNRVNVGTSYAHKEMKVNLDINKLTSNPFNGDLHLILKSADGVPLDNFTQSVNLVDSGLHTIKWDLVSAQSLDPWTPETPHLYRIEVQLKDNGARVIDNYETKIGFRDYTVSGQRVFLNGDELYLRGYGELNVFPETASPPVDKAFYIKTISAMKAAGFNHVRHHSSIPVEEYFEVADSIGVLVQVGMTVIGQWTNSGGYTISNTTKFNKLISVVRRTMNHPSMFLYMMGNEANNQGLVDDLRQIYDTLGANGLFSGSAHHEWKITRDNSHIIESNIDYADKPYFRHEYCHSSSFPNVVHQGRYTAFHPEGNIWYYDGALDGIDARFTNQYENWVQVSRIFQDMNRKASVEFFRQQKTNADGYSLWQGTDSQYIMGILDNFGDSKGTPTETLLKYNGSIVFLNGDDVETDDQGENPRFGSREVNLRKRVLRADSLFEGAFRLHNTSGIDIVNETVHWELVDHETGAAIASGSEVMSVANGARLKADITATLPPVSTMKRLQLKVRMDFESKTYENDWFYMLYPNQGTHNGKIYFTEDISPDFTAKFTDYFPDAKMANDTSEIDENGIIIASALNGSIRNSLKAGKKVFLLSKGLFDEIIWEQGRDPSRVPAKYATFLLASGYQTGSKDIFGLPVTNKAPFGTDFPFAHNSLHFMDNVFSNLLWRSSAIDMSTKFDETEIESCVEGIPRPRAFLIRKWSYLYQTNIDSGKMLGTGFTLNLQDIDALHMLDRFLNYMASGEFDPAARVTADKFFDAHYDRVGLPSNALTLNLTGNGSFQVSVNGQMVDAGDPILFKDTVVVTINGIGVNNAVRSLEMIGATGSLNADSSQISFTMPDNPVSINGVLSPRYQVFYDIAGAGLLTAKDKAGTFIPSGGFVFSGDSVFFLVSIHKEREKVTGISIDGLSETFEPDTTFAFVMPENDVNVEVATEIFAYPFYFHLSGSSSIDVTHQGSIVTSGDLILIGDSLEIVLNDGNTTNFVITALELTGVSASFSTDSTHIGFLMPADTVSLAVSARSRYLVDYRIDHMGTLTATDSVGDTVASGQLYFSGDSIFFDIDIFHPLFGVDTILVDGIPETFPSNMHRFAFQMPENNVAVDVELGLLLQKYNVRIRIRTNRPLQEFEVEVEGLLTDEGTVVVYNLLGNVVKSLEAEPGMLPLSFKIPYGDMQNGLYILRIHSGELVLVSKVLVWR